MWAVADHKDLLLIKMSALHLKCYVSSHIRNYLSKSKCAYKKMSQVSEEHLRSVLTSPDVLP